MARITAVEERCNLLSNFVQINKMQNYLNNTNFTINPIDVLGKQSLVLLGIVNSGPSQIFICLSLIGFFSGFSVFVTIVATKNLHTKNYALIACVAIGDMILAPNLMSIGIRRIIAYNNNTPMLFTQFQCMLEDCSRVFAMSVINSFFLGCAIDRFIAVTKPQWYSKVYPGWLFKLGVCFTFIRAASEALILFLGSSRETIIPICGFTFATTTDILDAQTIRSNFVFGGICLIYILTMAVVYVRLGKVKKQQGNLTEARKQMQTKIIWTLALMLGGYVATIIASAILYRFTIKQTFDVQLKYGAIGFTFQEFSAACNLIILTWKNQDFRKGLFRLYGFQKYEMNNAVLFSRSTRTTSTVSNKKEPKKSISTSIKSDVTQL